MKKPLPARPWMHRLSAKRMSQLIRQHRRLPVYANTTHVMVGDLLVLIDEVRAARKTKK